MFGTVSVALTNAPQQVALFLSAMAGWNRGVVDMAEHLRDAGALVVGIDVRAFVGTLESSTHCAYPAGALEELSRAIQRRYELASYMRPIRAISSGATLVRGDRCGTLPRHSPAPSALASVRISRCHRPLCQMRGLTVMKRAMDVGCVTSRRDPEVLRSRWMVAAGRDRSGGAAPRTPRDLSTQTSAATLYSLPKVGHGYGAPVALGAAAARWVSRHCQRARRNPGRIGAESRQPRRSPTCRWFEVRPQGQPIGSTTAIEMTGDGGWADLDKSVAAGLAAAGIAVIGWSSLDYYWRARTPGRGSAGLSREIIEHYTRAWHAQKVLVVGLLFGADVAPFLVNCLPSAVRPLVATETLLSPSRQRRLRVCTSP